MYDHRFVAAEAVAILVTLVAIFTLRPLARRIGLVDKPSGRKRHSGRIPLIGGLCFFLGTVAGLGYFGYLDRFVMCLVAMAALIFLAGLVDDIGELSVRSRLLIQAGTAGLMIAMSGVYLASGGHLFGDQEFRLHALGIPLTIIAVVGLVNAFNMLDGIDGLAGGLALTSIAAALTFAGAGWSTVGVALLLQIMAVTLIAYLGVNLGWPDGRKIFMGDAGSTLIGFVLAWSLIYMSQRQGPLLAPVDVLWCIALPVMDTFGVMWRRLRDGLSPFEPDRRHLHHLLLDGGCSPRQTLALIIGFSAALAAMGYALRGLPDIVSLAAFTTVLVAYVLWTPATARVMRRFGSRASVASGVPGLSAGLAANADKGLHWSARTSASGQAGATRSRPRRAVSRQPAPRQPAPIRTGAEPAVAATAPASSAAVKALCVLDASADSLKVGPVVQQLARDGRFDVEICVIALPDQESGRMLKLFDIHPHHVLDVKAPERDLADITSAPLRGMKRVLREHRPDVVLVHGETLASLAGTLAAYFQKIPVACIRTGSAVLGNPVSQASDEAVRKITGTLASLHIAATETAGRELLAAGIPQERVRMAGTTRADAAGARQERTLQERTLPQRTLQERAADARANPDGQGAGQSSERLLAERFPFVRTSRPLLLVANRERGDDDFIRIGDEMRALAVLRPDLDIVYPLHAHEQKPPPSRDGGASQPAPDNLYQVDPLDPSAFTYLLGAAYLVLARSADVQREATLLNKPVLMMRNDRDGIPAIHREGANRLVVDQRKIAECVAALLSDRRAYEAMCFATGPGSDGAMGMCIVEALAGLPQGAARAAA